jgi:hypothetical protein
MLRAGQGHPNKPYNIIIYLKCDFSCVLMDTVEARPFVWVYNLMRCNVKDKVVPVLN